MQSSRRIIAAIIAASALGLFPALAAADSSATSDAAHHGAMHGERAGEPCPCGACAHDNLDARQDQKQPQQATPTPSVSLKFGVDDSVYMGGP